MWTTRPVSTTRGTTDRSLPNGRHGAAHGAAAQVPATSSSPRGSTTCPEPGVVGVQPPGAGVPVQDHPVAVADADQRRPAVLGQVQQQPGEPDDQAAVGHQQRPLIGAGVELGDHLGGPSAPPASGLAAGRRGVRRVVRQRSHSPGQVATTSSRVSPSHSPIEVSRSRGSTRDSSPVSTDDHGDAVSRARARVGRDDHLRVAARPPTARRPPPAAAGLVQLDVAVALHAALDVPVGLAVPQQDQVLERHRGAVGTVGPTSAGSTASSVRATRCARPRTRRPASGRVRRTGSSGSPSTAGPARRTPAPRRAARAPRRRRSRAAPSGRPARPRAAVGFASRQPRMLLLDRVDDRADLPLVGAGAITNTSVIASRSETSTMQDVLRLLVGGGLRGHRASSSALGCRGHDSPCPACSHGCASRLSRCAIRIPIGTGDVSRCTGRPRRAPGTRPARPRATRCPAVGRRDRHRRHLDQGHRAVRQVRVVQRRNPGRVTPMKCASSNSSSTSFQDRIAASASAPVMKNHSASGSAARRSRSVSLV